MNVFSKIFQKIKLRIYKRRSEKYLRLIRFNLFLSQIILSNLYKIKYSEKDKEFSSQLGFIIARNHFFGKSPDSADKIYTDNRELYDEEYSCALSNKEFAEKYNTHLLLYKYCLRDSLGYHSNNRDKLELPEKLFDTSIPVLDKEQIDSLSRDVKREYNKKTKEIKEKLKLDKFRAEYEKLPKIEITPNKLITVFSIFSILFICTGVIYNQLYLGYFGIELSKFFSVTDYISSSIDKIFFSIVSLLVSAVVLFFFYPEYLRGQVPQKPSNELVIKIDKLLFKSLQYVFMPLLVIAIIILYYQKNLLFYQYLLIFLFFSLMAFSKHIVKYFKNTFKAFFVFWCVCLFLFNILYSVEKDIRHILNSEKADQKYKITFIDKEKQYSKDLVLLSANSKYFFFYDRNTKQAKVIPSDKISIVEISNIDKSFFRKYLIDHFQNSNM